MEPILFNCGFGTNNVIFTVKELFPFYTSIFNFNYFNTPCNIYDIMQNRGTIISFIVENFNNL